MIGKNSVARHGSVNNEGFVVEAVVDIAPDHDIEEHDILVSNFVEYTAGGSRVPTRGVGPHQLDAQGWV